MGKAKRSLEQLVHAESNYPGDVSSFYQPTPEGLLGEPDELRNNIQSLLKASIESGCTAQEAAGAIYGLFVQDEPKAKGKHG